MSQEPQIRTRKFQLAASARHAKILNHEFSVYEARPAEGRPVHGGVVVIQEIFGVNSHIRSVADRYAREGFVAWAPAFFDHVEPGVELGYEPRAFVKGRELASTLGWDQAVEDVRVAASRLASELPEGAPRKIAAVGFCWGGSVAWLSACRLEPGTIAAAVSYYGRATHEFRNETPKAPVLLHFGLHDGSIPMENVRDFQNAQPSAPVHVYDAGHGFNCDQRQDFDPKAARLAHLRTMTFLAENGLNA